jgi:hypothetical protein
MAGEIGLLCPELGLMMAVNIYKRTSCKDHLKEKYLLAAKFTLAIG